MTRTEQEFAKELIAYWLSFVRSGDPNTFKLPQSPTWHQYEASNRARIVLQQGTPTLSGSYVETEANAERARCDFVQSKTKEQQD